MLLRFHLIEEIAGSTRWATPVLLSVVPRRPAGGAAVVPSCGFGCARREEHTKEESDHNEPEQAFAVSSGASQKSEKNKT
jgi:hypothetical protein